MTSASEREFTTTILVQNIHCASCVSTIKEILNARGDAILHVDVNTLSQEVQIVHSAGLDILSICGALSNAAFEVHSAVSMDKNGVHVREIEFAPSDDDWLERLGDAGKSSFERLDDSARCLALPAKRASQGKHIQNCEACRKELESGISKPRDVDRVNDGRPTSKPLPPRGNSRMSVPKQVQEHDSNNAFGMDVESQRHARGQDEDQKYEVVLSIGGMTCSSCTSTVDRGVSGLPFVDSINVNLITNSAEVIFAGSINLQKIVDAIEDMGYDCTVDHSELLAPQEPAAPRESRTRTTSLFVHGMFCPHCPSQIEDVIKKRYKTTVELAKLPTLDDPILTITYEPSPPDFTIRNIIDTINTTNEAFSARPYTPPSIEQRSQAMQRREQRRLLFRLAFAFVAAIPTLLIGVVWMSLVPSDNGVRRYLEHPRLAGSVTGFEWALFFLSTPVMFLAADVFHVRAIKEIRAIWRPGSRVPFLRRFYRFGSMNLLISAGTSVAYFSSIAVLALNATTNESARVSNTTYFDSVVFLTFFILLGRWLEAYSRSKTGNAISMLKNLRPEKAVLVQHSAERTRSASSDSSEEEILKAQVSSTSTIETSLLEINDVVLVQHGASPPTDGDVFCGSTTFNESSLTGEARPVKKATGEKVYAGSINMGEAIQVKISELSGTSMLDQIISVVREGQTRRAPVERVVDIITGYFVPIITALAIITFVVWVSLGTSGALNPKYIEGQQGGWAFWSLEFAIAVFVVACPCGIGLAAPTALFVGSGLAAEQGILVRGGGEAFQEASKVDCVVFDKTGTLTEGGDLRVTDHEESKDIIDVNTAWTIAKHLEEISSHPLAQAILRLATTKTLEELMQMESIAEKPGMGVGGSFVSAGVRYEAALGSENFIQSLTPTLEFDYFTVNTLSRWKNETKSVALLAVRPTPVDNSNDNETSDANQTPWKLALIFAIADPIRASTIPTLNVLKAQKIPVYMLTGDNLTTASAVASTLSIPQDHVFAGVLPTEKADKIRWLQENLHNPSANLLSHDTTPPSDSHPSGTEKASKKYVRKTKKAHNGKNKPAIVAFVGDGINDAPALTAANVSISFSSATDIAVQSSSFVILSSQPITHSITSEKNSEKSNSSNDSDPLPSIPHLLALSHRVFNRVKFNFLWAMVYNVLLVPVAAGVLFRVRGGDGDGWRLGPVWGSAAMAGSSLCVVGSSLALRWEDQVRRWWQRRRRGDAKGSS